MDVSFIIPAFNRLWSLPEAIESCRDTRCSAEIIVVDDGSTDGTWEWLSKQKDLLVLRQQNLGKDWAVNLGFAHATGEYVRFLDSDDWCLAGATDAQLEIALRSNADIVVGAYTVNAKDGTLLREQNWVECDDFIAQQLGECDSSHYSAYLFRRNFIRDLPHRPEAGVRDDRLFVLEAALLKPNVAVFPGFAFAHRHHGETRLQFPTGLRATITNYQHLQIYRRVLGELEAGGELNERRKKAAANTLWPLAHWIAYSHRHEAVEVADWVFRLDPQFHVPENGLLGALYRRIGFRQTEWLLRIRRNIVALFSDGDQPQRLELK